MARKKTLTLSQDGLAQIVRELRAAEAVAMTAGLALQANDADYSREIELTLRGGCSTRLSVQIEKLEKLLGTS